MYNEFEVLRNFHMLIQERKNEEAYNFITKYCKEYPSMKLFNNAGWFLMRIGERQENGLMKKNYHKAIEFLITAIKILETSHYPFSNLGEACIQLRDYGTAKHILEKSVQIEHSIVNQNNLAYVLFQSKEYKEAEIQIDLLFNELSNISILDFVKKNMYSLNNITFFAILYNLVCIKNVLKKHTEADTILDMLLEYYYCNLIDICDIDVIDIIELCYIRKRYDIIVSLLPKSNYDINEKSFMICADSLLKMNMDLDSFYNNIINELNEELNDIEDEYYLKKIKNKADNIKKIYNKLKNHEKCSIYLDLKFLEGNYVFYR